MGAEVGHRDVPVGGHVEAGVAGRDRGVGGDDVAGGAAADRDGPAERQGLPGRRAAGDGHDQPGGRGRARLVGPTTVEPGRTAQGREAGVARRRRVGAARHPGAGALVEVGLVEREAGRQPAAVDEQAEAAGVAVAGEGGGQQVADGGVGVVGDDLHLQLGVAVGEHELHGQSPRRVRGRRPEVAGVGVEDGEHRGLDRVLLVAGETFAHVVEGAGQRAPPAGAGAEAGAEVGGEVGGGLLGAAGVGHPGADLGEGVRGHRRLGHADDRPARRAERALGLGAQRRDQVGGDDRALLGVLCAGHEHVGVTGGIVTDAGGGDDRVELAEPAAPVALGPSPAPVPVPVPAVRRQAGDGQVEGGRPVGLGHAVAPVVGGQGERHEAGRGHRADHDGVAVGGGVGRVVGDVVVGEVAQAVGRHLRVEAHGRVVGLAVLAGHGVVDELGRVTGAPGGRQPGGFPGRAVAARTGADGTGDQDGARQCEGAAPAGGRGGGGRGAGHGGGGRGGGGGHRLTNRPSGNSTRWRSCHSATDR